MRGVGRQQCFNPMWLEKIPNPQPPTPNPQALTLNPDRALVLRSDVAGLHQAGDDGAAG